MRRTDLSSRAFTLIELLIVVAIIGILAAIAVPNFLNAHVRAKIAKAESELRTITTALESYRLDNNIYPPWLDANGVQKNPVNRRLIPLTTPVSYMPMVPQDPFLYGPPGARIVESQDAAYVTYDYTDAWSRIHFGKLTILPMQARCAEFKVTSAGPDFENTWGNTVTYMVTNGLTSRGDIIKLGARASWPCDDTLVGT
ncbi:MAG TPA: prepilin-type N-terminal cleavage/methylation domain-containing protein [bacterium]|nr:prepilin-type N-terminal cleavage/methylation domain-containing protein [Candidatus Omnitrophota bacterium]HOJ61560.1 prepilin-type N-terminal cleavage/methylation domain-containing protein [bacterium]HOL92857.1 prepilin-type N-terminal cleavage/methylation domain-containing protein [bacterium]HPP01231.1 prepilin-type N-terminal cleavage/methylation domain-containing protein [bacterium]HXK92766.1 prepilin-type N-terminal cleavage/methylation domain-containing protein [bacterium]